MKIVILGTAPASMNLAPFGGDWEIWSCSPGTYGVPKIDKFFELHRFEPGQEWFSEGYVQFLKDFKGEVIMSKAVKEIPNCKVLPYESLVKKYGPYFFTSSIAWMIAMAIDEKPEKIAMFGVDMAATTEYHDQRMGCQYFSMLAKSNGIEIGVPPESDLLRPAPLYGVCENSHVWIKQTARARELAGRLRIAETERQNKSDEVHFIKGAMDDQDWNLHSWFGASDTLGQEFTEPPDVPALKEVKGNGFDYQDALEHSLGLDKPVVLENPLQAEEFIKPTKRGKHGSSKKENEKTA